MFIDNLKTRGDKGAQDMDINVRKELINYFSHKNPWEINGEAIISALKRRIENAAGNPSKAVHFFTAQPCYECRSHYYIIMKFAGDFIKICPHCHLCYLILGDSLKDHVKTSVIDDDDVIRELGQCDSWLSVQIVIDALMESILSRQDKEKALRKNGGKEKGTKKEEKKEKKEDAVTEGEN